MSHFAERIEGWRARFRALDQHANPLDIPLPAWRTFLRDCSAFLASDWALQALGLGWDEYSLFGANRIKPYARIDHAGLLWLAQGQAMREMRDEYVRFAHGLVYSRHLFIDPDELAMPWELER